ncbi:MAG: hypothetical protein ABJE66_13300 [Deltaproteobacteria bacterium]
MSQFADDVAKALHKRIRRRKLAFFAIGAALIAALVYFVTCGHGFGLGGQGKGSGIGPGVVAASDAGPTRCTVRVDKSGYSVDGKASTTTKEIVDACRKTAGAEVTVTGDAREGSWTELERALEAAHIPVYQR